MSSTILGSRAEPSLALDVDLYDPPSPCAPADLVFCFTLTWSFMSHDAGESESELPDDVEGSYFYAGIVWSPS